jgi:hypothetical protein
MRRMVLLNGWGGGSTGIAGREAAGNSCWPGGGGDARGGVPHSRSGLFLLRIITIFIDD